MTSSERLVAKSLKLPVHPIVSRRSRRARASLLAAPTTTRLIQPSLETPSANAPRARARASRPTAPPIDPPASNHAAFASSRALSSRASAPARPPRSRRHAPRCVHARYPPTDSFAPASAQIARTVSVAGSMRRSARARRRVAPRARRTVRRSRRVPTAVDARAPETRAPIADASRRARQARDDRGRRDDGSATRFPRTRATRRDDDEVSRAFDRRRAREFVGSTRGDAREARASATRARPNGARGRDGESGTSEARATEGCGRWGRKRRARRGRLRTRRARTRGANGEEDSRDASAESDDARGSSDDLGWGDGRR